MSKLTDQIITESNVADKRINTMPLHPSEEGWSGVSIQNRFDAVPTTLLALTTLTNIINILSENIDVANSGAVQIGAAGFDSQSSNVQAVLNSLITMANDAVAALATKVDKEYKPSDTETISIEYGTNGVIISYTNTATNIDNRLVISDDTVSLSFGDSVLEITPTQILLNGREPIFDAPSYLVKVDTFADLPATGSDEVLYFVKENQAAYVWDGTSYMGIILPTWVNTLEAGTATSLPPGSQPTVSNSGTAQNAVFDFGIPKGDKGDKGDAATIAVGTTTTGEPGTNAIVTNSGTSGAATFNFTIPRGATGNTGTIEAGTATSLPAGSAPTVSNSGTSTAARFNFGIPKGDTGATGATGTPGAAATIAAGTATSLPPGSTPTVTNVGTSSAARFNFGIPQGQQGVKGDKGNPGVPGTSGALLGTLTLATGDWNTDTLQCVKTLAGAVTEGLVYMPLYADTAHTAVFTSSIYMLNVTTEDTIVFQAGTIPTVDINVDIFVIGVAQ